MPDNKYWGVTFEYLYKSGGSSEISLVDTKTIWYFCSLLFEIVCSWRVNEIPNKKITQWMFIQVIEFIARIASRIYTCK